MRKHRLVLFTTLVFGIAIGLGLHVAIGQQTPPTQPKGMKVIKASALDLGPQIEEMRGWRLGMRVVQMEPGGHFVMHYNTPRKLDRGIRCMLACQPEGGMAWFRTCGRPITVLSRPR